MGRELNRSNNFAALDATREILAKIGNHETNLPGVFPTLDGGVLVEWSSPQFVKSIEIGPNANFQLFRTTLDLESGFFLETSDISKAIDFGSFGGK